MGVGGVGAVQRVCVYSEYLYCRFLHGSMCVLEGEGGGSSLSTFLSACECVFGTVWEMEETKNHRMMYHDQIFYENGSSPQLN